MADMDKVNEASTLILTVAFFDDLGAAIVPTTATYRIEDAAGTRIAPPAGDPATSVPITGLAVTVDIEITPAQNAILLGKAIETRYVTVVWTYGAARQRCDVYEYQVLNLRGVPAT
jgi:hypothetical protein